MMTGRNDLCPCGSGRKYKKCCLQTAPNPLNYMKEKLSRFHDRVIEELFLHSTHLLGSEGLVKAREEFLGWPDEDDEPVEEEWKGHELLFYPWFIFKWEIDLDGEGESNLELGERSVAESYLQAHGKGLDPREREYLEGLITAPFSFFQTTGVEVGVSVSARDLFLDREYLVLDKASSQVLKKGDIFFGSVVEVGGIALFGGLSMITFEPDAKVGILEMKQKLLLAAGGGKISGELLDEYDMEIRDLYFLLYRQRMSRPLLVNTEGNALSFQTLKYTISSPQTVFEALKGLTNGFVSEEELLAEAKFDENGELSKVEIPWIVLKDPAGDLEKGNVVYGDLLINGSKMSCKVNSAARAEQLRGLIKQRLPADQAVYKTKVVQSVEAKMKTAKNSAPVEHEELMKHPEVRQKLEEILLGYWEQWPDMVLPALQGQTAREAVHDPLGREQVKALLEHAERQLQEQPEFDKDCGLRGLKSVRQALGLDGEQSS